MKIAIDVSQIVFAGTGVANFTAQLVEELVKYKQHDFLLFGYSWGKRKILRDFLKKYASLNHVTTKLIPWPHHVVNIWGNFWHKINIEDLIGRFDILHTSDWVEFPSRKIKVTTIHDLVVYRFPQHLHKTIRETQKRKLELVAKESRLVFADSESTKKDIMQYLPIAEAKIRVVYLGVDDKYYKRPVREIKQVQEKYRLPEKYFLFVGKREPRKNLQRLIEAFHQVQNNQIYLVIAGGKGWGDEVSASVRVKVLDYINLHDLPALYCGAFCFVYPSLYEGFGLPVLEAMKCEVPVVTSNKGSLAEIAHASILVDPEKVESIVQGLKHALEMNPANTREMIKKNLEFAQKFTWKKTAQQVMQIYENIFLNE